MTDTKLNLDQPEFPVVVNRGPQTVSIAASDSVATNILLVDPALCQPFAGNGRAESPFDAARNRALIESIKADGQVSPALVRRIATGGYEIIAGTRRWHAVKHLREKGAQNTQFKVRVVDLDDDTAWRESSAENVGRAAYTPLQLARSWRWAIEHTYAGEQQTFAVDRGIDPGVLSRTLALLQIPPVVQSAHADFEHASVHFAEQIAPALRDPERCLQILQIAKNLTSTGVKLTGPRLVERLLLSPSQVEASRRKTWTVGENQRAATWTKDEKGGVTLRLTAVSDGVRLRDRSRMFKALSTELRQHLGLTSVDSASAE